MRKFIVGTETFRAASVADLVKQMWEVDPAVESQKMFMSNMAKRVKLQNGKDVRTDTPENFIADLTSMGLVKEGA
jgi:DNA-binding transcriptional regulator PaaX